MDLWLVPGYGGGIMKKTIELEDHEWGQVVDGLTCRVGRGGSECLRIFGHAFSLRFPAVAFSSRLCSSLAMQ